MEGEEKQQLNRARERLKLLLTTHLKRLPHETLRPAVGEVVMKQGAPAKTVMLVKMGQLNIEFATTHGPAQVIAVVGRDELLGEMGLVGDNHHSATVRVESGPAELISINADELLQASLFDSELVMELLALSSARCRQTNKTIAILYSALEALATGERSTLATCCEELSHQVGQAETASALLLELAKRLHTT